MSVKVRQKNPLLEAHQFTTENAEAMQEKFSGLLLWGRSEDGIPQPTLELKNRERGLRSLRVTVGQWIISNNFDGILDVITDEVYRREYVPEEDE